jgi:hypothetical protein
MVFEFALFTITGAVVYYYAGQFSTAPGYGSMLQKLGKVAAGFTLPTIIIVGILYSLVTSRAIFFQVSCDARSVEIEYTVVYWSGSVVPEMLQSES